MSIIKYVLEKSIVAIFAGAVSLGLALIDIIHFGGNPTTFEILILYWIILTNVERD